MRNAVDQPVDQLGEQRAADQPAADQLVEQRAADQPAADQLVEQPAADHCVSVYNNLGGRAAIVAAVRARAWADW
jgi:hypothetical protein